MYVWRPGSGSKRLRQSSDAKDWPQWSPDGKLIAFQAIPGWNGEGSCVDCPFRIWVMRANGTHPVELTQDTGSSETAVQPSWSPDGSRIVFTRQFADRPDELAIVSLRTHRERALHVAGDDPIWGRRGIAYAYAFGPHLERAAIRLLDEKSGRSEAFGPVPSSYEVAAMAWSSRGELAALELGPRPGGLPVRVIIYTGSGRQVSQFEALHHHRACGLTWSPDGKHLLLTGTRLYEVDPNGKHWRGLRLQPTSCTTSWR
jgi:Tol biopolymer transport system component